MCLVRIGSEHNAWIVPNTKLAMSRPTRRQDGRLARPSAAQGQWLARTKESLNK